MNKKIIFFSLAALAGSLILLPLQNSNAATYVGHDGSVSEYLTKVTVKQYKKGSSYWSYIVKACAKDYPLAVAGIELKSDIDKVSLGVNKNIPKGQCSFYGAVMQANNGQTLGATLILKSDVVQEAQDIIAKLPTSTQKEQLTGRLMELYNLLGFIPRF